MQHRKILLAAVTLGILVGVGWWLAQGRAAHRVSRPEAKPLEFYRDQFRRADGSLPDDTELRQMLQAKGVPYQENCPPGQHCGKGVQGPVSALPEVEFPAGGFTSAQRDQLRAAIASVLGGQLDELRRITPDLRLERVAIDSGMKLQLYFNRQFAQIADDEMRLNDFSEGLHSLGSAGLRGSVFYIDGQPLGLYLQKRDAELNREARAQSPETNGESRR